MENRDRPNLHVVQSNNSSNHNYRGHPQQPQTGHAPKTTLGTNKGAKETM
jgi:hypothetical protein